MMISLGFATKAALLSGVLLGISKLLFTAWVVFVVDRWGRKPLLLIGNVLMAVTLTGCRHRGHRLWTTSQARASLMLVY